VPSSALLGQQMQRLQAETHSRVAPLLSELESSGRQTVALQARREALARELRAVEADVAAAGARSQALQASADEAQDLYERSLQALLATHTPAPAPAVTAPDPAAAEALAETAASLEALVADLLGNVRRVESAMGAFRPPVAPQSLTKTAALSAASSAALAQQVSGRVSASAAALADYVEAEGRCLWALAERVARGRARLQTLRVEESAFRGLKMQVRRSITSG
jgi:septal ring factor EnvC (AmiA/AmiB activator)